VTQQLLVGALVLAADRYSKAAVSARLRSGRVLRVGPCLRIHYVLTRFKTHGLVQSPTSLAVIWTATAALLAMTAHLGLFFKSPAAQIGLAAALAGSGSNLYDRLRHGAVIDFLDVGWWPVSNLADIALVAGVIVALGFLCCAL
jgi:signal peptidase II